MTREQTFKDYLHERMMIVGPRNFRLFVWESTGDLYTALGILFDHGYRGKDLKPPKGWIRKR